MQAQAQLLQGRFIQGVYPFEGRGLTHPFRLTADLFYRVPPEKRAQLLYVRAGNSTDVMIYLLLMENDHPKRYFPLGARADAHVALAITEDIDAGSHVEVFVAAPEQVSGWIVIDIGFVEF